MFHPVELGLESTPMHARVIMLIGGPGTQVQSAEPDGPYTLWAYGPTCTGNYGLDAKRKDTGATSASAYGFKSMDEAIQHGLDNYVSNQLPH